MKLTINITADAVIEYEVKNEKDVFKAMGFWQSLPKVCPECGASVAFDYRNPQDNSYYLLACTGPVRHESALGQNRTGDTLYYKNGWKQAFRGYGHGDEEPKQQVHPREASEREILMGEIRQLAPLKQTTELKIANGMSGEREQKLEGLTTEQLRQALEILKKK
jgi:hypothetical protein